MLLRNKKDLLWGNKLKKKRLYKRRFSNKMIAFAIK